SIGLFYPATVCIGNLYPWEKRYLKKFLRRAPPPSPSDLGQFPQGSTSTAKKPNNIMAQGLLCWSHMQHRSIWHDFPGVNFPQLDENLTVDTCVIGAGIVGLSVAYQLL